MQFKEYKHTNAVMTDDTEWVDAVPPGYEIEKIVFVESAGNAATIDAGSTSGGNDLFKNQVIEASEITTVVINKTISMSTRKSVFINDDDAGSDWNGASLISIMLMRRVLI